MTRRYWHLGERGLYGCKLLGAVDLSNAAGMSQGDAPENLLLRRLLSRAVLLPLLVGISPSRSGLSLP
jgi:hypothetical protein